MYQKQIQDLEREQEEIEIRVNAVREGRMRVAGAIERSQTVKEQLNVRIIGLDHQIEEIKRQINDQEKEKDSSSQKIEEINEKKKRSEIECHNAKRIEETLIAERRNRWIRKERNIIECVPTMKQCGIWQNVMMDMDSGSRK